jgi:DNA-binding NarL/FixJ family response regulator
VAIGRPATVAKRATEIRALVHEGLSTAAIARKLDLGYASVHCVVAGSLKASG